MEYYFDTREKYIRFLDKLATYCDKVVFLEEDDDADSEFIEVIKPQMIEVKRISGFPGYGNWRRGVKTEVPFYYLNKKVVSAFKIYDSFLQVGYDSKTGLGLDMAFYRESEVVFYVIRHEDMCYLVEEHNPFFIETIEMYQI